MKSTYEIAWDITKWSIESEHMSQVLGIPIEDIEILKYKRQVLERIEGYPLYYNSKNNLSLIKQVVQEIEQGRPHWEIEESK